MGDFMNWLPAVLGVLALLFAAYLIRKVGKADPGTERMQEIAGHIHQGARAFLMAEYRIRTMLGDIYKILAEAIDIDLSALEA